MVGHHAQDARVRQDVRFPQATPLRMIHASDPQLVLASASPRRRELLEQIGVRCRVIPAHIDEQPQRDEAPADYVRRLALAKARAVGPIADGLAVLGSDTTVTVDGHILGKPRDRDHGLAMLAQLSNRSHEVYSGVALVGAREEVVASVSRVTFRRIGAEERAAYWATGEPVDKAGAYAIQGRGAIFVAGLEGSYSGVMGLPLFETAQLLSAAGIPVLQARSV